MPRPPTGGRRSSPSFGRTAIETSPSFLEDSGIELSDVLRRRPLVDPAAARSRPTDQGRVGDLEKQLLKRIRGPSPMLTTRSRAAAYRRLLADDTVAYEELVFSRSSVCAQMLFFSLWPNGGKPSAPTPMDCWLYVSERASERTRSPPWLTWHSTGRSPPSPIALGESMADIPLQRARPLSA